MAGRRKSAASFLPSGLAFFDFADLLGQNC